MHYYGIKLGSVPRLELAILVILAIAQLALTVDLEEIRPDDFERVVLKEDGKSWFIFFHHMRCGHCVSLVEEFEDAAEQVAEGLHFGIVDATGQIDFQNKYEIEEFPRLAMYIPGRKDFPIKQPGWRSETESKADQIVAFAMHTLNENDPERMAKLERMRKLQEQQQAAEKQKQQFDAEKDKQDFMEDDPEMAAFGDMHDDYLEGGGNGPHYDGNYDDEDGDESGGGYRHEEF